ncbi:MAG: DUF4190 domain-containing protein [Flavobacteriales bacterium]|nr:DUF4190 domain-containing protein [Flavobacteriales bacterium]
MKRITILFFTLVTLANLQTYASFPVTENQENFITQGECDNIILKDGEEISAKIIEITPDLIKYKRCNNLDGPLFSINKSEVMMVRYSDGTKDIMKQNSRNNEDDDYQRSQTGVNVFGIVSLSCAFLSLLFLNLLFPICAIIFGAIGMSRKYKKKKLKGLAISGMVLGILDVVLLLIFLA